MRNDEQHIKMKHCLDAGYRIYVKPINNYTCKLVIAKATKYKWSDIPKEKEKQFEQVDGIIYSLKIGETIFKQQPKTNEDKYWDKIHELYRELHKKLTLNNK
jgi:hypothetical protein